MLKELKTKDDRYMAIAEIWAGNSYAKRAKVGAILVKDQMIISDGYNGTPKGFDNSCEHKEIESVRRDDGTYKTVWVEKTKPWVLHAEANAITKVAKSNNSSEGSTLYVTMAPCVECSKLIIQSGIERVVYKEDYRNRDGIRLLEMANIQVDRLGK